MPFQLSLAIPQTPFIFGFSPVFDYRTPQPRFPVYSNVGDYVLYFQQTPHEEREVARITTLNVMGIFVTDVKLLILKAVALWVRRPC